MPVAVLFKTHFWTSYVEQQMYSLLAQSADTDFWVVYDATHSDHPKLPSGIRSFVSTEIDLAALGLLCHPSGRANWYNVDYQTIAFHAAHPEYTYIASVEYDVVVQFSLASMMKWCEDECVDLLAVPIRSDSETWAWRSTCEEIWPRSDILGNLLCLSIMSARAIETLSHVRQVHAEQYRSGAITNWPFCEALVPTALSKAGYRICSLDDLGETETYDWWPPFHSSELANYSARLLLHPVLTGKLFVESTLRYQDVELWFNVDSLLRRRLALEVPDIVLPILSSALLSRSAYQSVIALRGFIVDSGLADLAKQVDEALVEASSSRATVDLAEGSYAYQSSVCIWSPGKTPHEDAQQAVEPRFGLEKTFHTEFEIYPWWSVDLGQVAVVDEVHIWNRSVETNRARALTVYSSIDGRNWSLLSRHCGILPCVTSSNSPLVIRSVSVRLMRFVRIESQLRDYLHLDRVRVFGRHLS